MTHFRLEEWTDFQKGVASQEREKAMREHLAAGCDDCRESHSFVALVDGFVTAEPAQTPAADVVRLAKVLSMGLPARRSQPARALEVIADLLFDSSLEPAIAGIRGVASAGRHLAFTAGDYRIDVRIDSYEPTGKCSILGQVLQSSYSAANVGVVLSSDECVIGSAFTDHLGEFEFADVDRAQDMTMVLVPEGTEPLIVKLTDVADAGKSQPTPDRSRT